MGGEIWERTAASGISMSRFGWGGNRGRVWVWVGGSIGSGGGGSGMEWMLSMGGIGVDASETSGGGMGPSSAIVSVAIGMILECVSMIGVSSRKRIKMFTL